MFRALLMLCLIFLLNVSVMAQDGYPLPNDLAPIASDNAIRLQQLASVGSLLQGQLLWSPDGTRLVVGTSADTRLYNAADFSAAPIVILDAPKTGSILSFNADGELVINGQRWNVQTGELLGAVPPSVVPPIINGVTVEVVSEGEASVLELTIPDGQIITLPIVSEMQLDYQQILFSPDNAYAALVFGRDDYSYEIQLWHLATGSRLLWSRFLSEIVDTLSFHADGQLLIAATYTDSSYGGLFDGIQIWDGRTGAELFTTSYSSHIVFSPNKELFAFITDDGVSIWRERELAQLSNPDWEYFDGGMRPATFLFSPDSNTIAATAESDILFWELDREQISLQPNQTITPEAIVGSMLYTPDASRLVALESGGIIEVWDLMRGTRTIRIATDNNRYRLQVSPDGKLVSAANNNDTVVWDIETGELRLTVPRNAVFNTDWTMVTYWEDGIVRVESPKAQPATEINVIPDYMGRLVAFNPVVGWGVFSWDIIRAYNLMTGAEVFSHSLGTAELTADGRYLLMRHTPPEMTTSVLDIWDTTTFQQTMSNLHIDGYGSILLSSNLHYLSQLRPACGDGGGGSIALYNLPTDTSVNFRANDCGPYSHTFSPDEKWLVVGWSYDITIMDVSRFIEDLANPEADMPSHQPQSGFSFFYHFPRDAQVAFNPDGSLLLVMVDTETNMDGQHRVFKYVEIWRLEDLTQPPDVQRERGPMLKIENATQAVFSSDSEYIATNIGLWSLATGEQMVAFNSTATAFNSDSTILATYTENTVTLWDVSVLEHGHGDAMLVTLNIPDVQELAFNPDSTLLYIKRAGDVQVWGVAPR